MRNRDSNASGTSRGHRRWVLLLALGAVGCNPTAASGDLGSHTAPLSTLCDGGQDGTQLFLPQGVSLANVTLAAFSKVTLADRVQVAGITADVGNAGVETGTDCVLGEIDSVGTVTLRDRTRTGNIRTTVPVLLQSQVTTGTIDANATLLPAVATTLAQPTSTPSMGDIVLNSGGNGGTIGPGTYGQFALGPNAIITLSAGVYHFATLDLDVDSKVTLGPGTFVLDADASTMFRGTIVQPSASHPDLLIKFYGATLTIERTFDGFVFAPSAALHFTGNLLTYTGAFFASTIQVDAGLILANRAFDPTHFYPL